MAKTRKTKPSPPPDWLSPTAREVWLRTADDLAEIGLYDPAFDDILGNYCLGQGAIIDASKRGDPPQAALLNQCRQLAIALAIDPEARRHRLYVLNNRLLS